MDCLTWRRAAGNVEPTEAELASRTETTCGDSELQAGVANDAHLRIVRKQQHGVARVTSLISLERAQPTKAPLLAGVLSKPIDQDVFLPLVSRSVSPAMLDSGARRISQAILGHCKFVR